MNYERLLSQFYLDYGDRDIQSITSDEALHFLTRVTEGTKQSTKRLRFSLLSAFFNFTRDTIDIDLHNPCDTPMLRKIFKAPKPNQWKILDKDVIDEIIFRAIHPRNRIMLELMARGGIRVGDVLNLIPSDIDDCKIIIRDPKSGKGVEVVFIPQKIADRLKGYIRDNKIILDERIFPITYPAARMAVRRAGKLVGIDLKPHDLRRHAATYASRSGTPIEIVSKLILRHANLSTTQRYLGKITDSEAMRWRYNLYS